MLKISGLNNHRQLLVIVPSAIAFGMNLNFTVLILQLLTLPETRESMIGNLISAYRDEYKARDMTNQNKNLPGDHHSCPWVVFLFS